MAYEVTTSVLTELIPALIEARTIPYAATNRVFRNLIGDENAIDMGTVGATTKIAQDPDVAFAAATGEAVVQAANTAFDPTARTLTAATYRIHMVCSWEGRTYSQGDPYAMISRAVGRAWNVLEDQAATGFAGLYGEPPSGGDIGTDAVAMDGALIRTAGQILLTNGGPMPYRGVIDPIQWAEVLSEADAREQLKASVGRQLNTTGTVDPRRFLGMVYNVELYVADAMIESFGLHAEIFAQGGIGLGYKRISTPASPTPSEINIEATWDPDIFGWAINATVIHDVSGLTDTSTTNRWLVNAIS